MKNALICILIGFIFAIASCSAIRMTKSNIKVQNPDTNKAQVQIPPPVPAFIIVQPGTPTEGKQHRSNFQGFKDSVINGLMSIRQAEELNKRKIDSGLHRQSTYINSQNDMVKTLIDMQGTINSLSYDNLRLTKKANVSQATKEDAVFGNTFKTFAVYVLIFIAAGIVSIIILTLYLHSSLSKNIKKLTNNHAT